MDSRALDVDLGELIIFAKVVEEGSFTSAAKALRLPKSTVSRKISELEQRVDARLLQRTTRTLSLTDIGRIYYEHCVRIVSEVENAQLAIEQLQSTPSGLLRVTAPLAFSILSPVIAEYLRRFPDVRMELVCTDRRVDIVEERFDIALRAGPVGDANLIARRLGVVKRRLVAAASIMDELGEPEQLADLSGHPCVAFAPEGNTWNLGLDAGQTADVTVTPRLTVNDYGMLLAVAREGLGIALLPDYLCAEDLRMGRLRAVLDPWSGPEIPVFALYPSKRFLAPAVAAFLDLLSERLQLADTSTS